MGIPAFEAVRMLCSHPSAAAGWDADHQRHRELSSGHMRYCRGVIDDLIERQKAEVYGHDFDDRPHTDHRRADAGTDIGALGEWRVTDALFTEFVEQALGDGIA